MIATCPSNPKHKKFTTSAHVMEEWLVDENGNWLETLSTLETIRSPHPDGIWTCIICGTDADVEA